MRAVCAHCSFVDYKNPKIVVGAVATWDEKILMCRRAIEPRKGFWTLPAGFLEISESVEAGAMREAYEEARARIEIDRVLAVYSVPRIAQVHIMFRARLLSPDVAAGPESLETAMLDYEDIPWKEIAFPTVSWALKHFHESRRSADFATYSNPHGGL